MTAHLARRTAQMLLVVYGVVTLTFITVRLVPGDPARLMEPPGTPETIIQLVRQQIGTDKPLHVQYGDFLAGLPRGDLGKSFRGGRPVGELIAAYLPNTLLLGIVAMAVATALASIIGIGAALRRNSVVDRAALFLVAVAQSTPNFWLGVMLVLVFAVQLRWLPAIDMSGPESFVLPVATLAVTLLPLLVRTVRQSFIDALGDDHVRAARARGIPEHRVLLIHVLKVASLPLVTLVGLQAGFVLGGSVVVESIFNWPGIGTLALKAIQDRDFPMIQGTVLVIAIVFTLVNFVVDLVYAALDPRIRY
ncbi:MAG TPA: ABC transporter permease [Candidatus Limnocylindria bacterium]|jgi:peptide/nickel transport system permease protein|nr:ABC transporter permease [Candidatus Limnocylindria bacterium]